MKAFYSWINSALINQSCLIGALGLLLLGCNSVKKEVVSLENLDNRFAQFSTLKATREDSTAFIVDLKKASPNVFDGIEEQTLAERITEFSKTRIDGGNADCFLISYEYDGMTSSTFPWKRLLVFSEDGKLIESFSALRARIVSPNQHAKPMLLCTSATAAGNGSHGLFRFVNDSLTNVLKYKSDKRTYDCDPDGSMYDPCEMNLVFRDLNSDGMEDILFSSIAVTDYSRDSVFVKFYFDAASGSYVEVSN